MIKPQTKNLIRTFWHFMHEYRREVYLSLLLMLATLVFELAMPLILEHGLEHIRAGDIQALTLSAWIFLILIVGEFFSRTAFSYLLSIALLKTINQLRAHVFQHVLHMKMVIF